MNGPGDYTTIEKVQNGIHLTSLNGNPPKFGAMTYHAHQNSSRTFSRRRMLFLASVSEVVLVANGLGGNDQYSSSSDGFAVDFSA